MHALKIVDKMVGGFLRWGSVAILALLFILLSVNVLVRFVPVISFGWFDEIIEMLIAWMVFLGTAALWRENEHFTVSFLPERLQGKKSGHFLDILISLISLFFIGVFTYYSFNLTMRANDWTPVINMPKKLLYVCMPISGLFMTIYSIRNIVVSSMKICRKH